MPRQKTTNLDSVAEEGSALVELVAWLALVAIPTLLLSVQAVRVNQAYAATQSIARELAREASLGLDYGSTLPELAADYGLGANDFRVTVECANGQSACGAYRAKVAAVAYRFLPVATSTMLVTP